VGRRENECKKTKEELGKEKGWVVRLPEGLFCQIVETNDANNPKPWYRAKSLVPDKTAQGAELGSANGWSTS